MMNNYKLILTSELIYREIPLKFDMTQCVIGTDAESDIRFREDEFIAPFSFSIINYNGIWRIECQETVYIETETHEKRIIFDLSEGDNLQLKYAVNHFDLFRVSLELDFDINSKEYNACIPLEGKDSLKVSGDPVSDICLNYFPKSVGGFYIERRAGIYYIRPSYTGRIPVMINGVKVTKINELKSLDFVSFGPYCFCFKRNKLYYDFRDDLIIKGLKTYQIQESSNALLYPEFNRSTRIKELLNEEKIEVLDPPAEPTKPRNNIFIQLFPAIAMLLVTVLLRYILKSSGVQFLIISGCTMGIGVITSVMNIIQERKKYKEDIAHREEVYNNYIDAKRDFIKKAREEEAQILERTYYPLEQEWAMMKDFSSKLFERDIHDQDFLDVRLGTGRRESVRVLDIKKRERLEDTDKLMHFPEQLQEETRFMDNVPVTLSLLGKSQIGVVGNWDKLLNFCKLITVDLVSRQFYSDVRLLYCIGERDQDAFEWFRYIPHVKNELLDRRNIICDEESKNILFEFLYRLLSGDRTEESLPHYIIFVYRDWGIQTHPISEMMEQAESKGVTFILFNKKEELLHNKCDYIIRLDDNGNGRKIDTHDGTKVEEFSVPVVSDRKLKAFVRKLAPIYCKEINLEGSLTKSISFFEMYHIYEAKDINLERNWATSEVWNSLAAPLGVKAKNQLVKLDINEKAHGPHGLVAGTTGSGKSEILQTYILSMALHFHPYDVAFMIIDFKGGGMVNQFRLLPHLVGAITNIDGKEIDRSLQSIRAELKKREQLFAEFKVNHIDAYIRLFRQGIALIPLPHLILIVDEFAELKMEQPEFMKELISTARVGRSLGVHLILATQKPSGVVDPQIWSNSRFKLCLKVQTREDSNEVLKNPLAAEIREPGRAYLQIGNNEVLELFQSAYSGAPVKEEKQQGYVLSTVSLSGKKSVVYEKKAETSDSDKVSQLDSLVKYISMYFYQSGERSLPYICLEPMPLSIAYPSHRKAAALDEGLKAYIGIFDDPSRQRQEEFFVNITTQHTFIIGSAQNGKTNLLQTILVSLTEQYTPDEINIYVIDFGSMIFRNYEELKHVGGVVCTNDDEKLKNLFKLLGSEIDRRKEAILKAGVGSFAAYLEAGYKDMPQIVVIIDNLTALRELYLMETDILLPLIREGVGVGISFIIANIQTSGIGYKYLSNFENRIALYCNDSTEYSVLFENCRKRPDNNPGRALIEIDKEVYEAQIYLSFDGEREIERVKKIHEYVETRNNGLDHKQAKLIPYVPPKLTERVLQEKFTVRNDLKNYAIGVDFEQVEPFYLNLIKDPIWAISGPEESGKENFVKYLTCSFLQNSFQLYIMDDSSGQLSFAEEGASLYSDSLEDMDEILSSFSIQSVNNKTIGQQNMTVLMINHPQAVEWISKENRLLARYRDLVSDSKNQNSIILWTNVDNIQINFNSPEVLKMMKDDKRFVIFENIDNIKLADFTTALKRQYRKELKEDDAYVIRDNQIHKIKTVTKDSY